MRVLWRVGSGSYAVVRVKGRGEKIKNEKRENIKFPAPARD